MRVFKNRKVKISKPDSNRNMSLLNYSCKYIKIIRTGNPVMEKRVTSSDDIKRIKKFFTSIKIKKIPNPHVKGWAFSITMVNNNKDDLSISIFGDKISYNDSFYSIDKNVPQEFHKIYNELHYVEQRPKIQTFDGIEFEKDYYKK
ncbi:hypothetical protein BJV85_000539 [Clostridium acetobutylicum]|nr:MULTISPECIES: hypothetical protein [Clostridium]NOV87571.1 hypothetical protein [Clostridium acetobutylicum]NOW14088.1 hypothetical protein [Clostridium acetobutylicum]NRY58102.1 hypothetical protein [Clostridium acetobutylicum]NSA91693.1 hypothetical protein [Clostridium acetobutylicum]NYC92641.1 hypothetical protein [Clostridium acetobutylicum]